jgi:hypothetical protein
MRELRKKGYDIHLLATQKYPHKTIIDVAKRFINNKPHRFVPLVNIVNTGNDINRNIMLIRRSVDDYEIYDTSNNSSKLISHGHNRKPEGVA